MSGGAIARLACVTIPLLMTSERFAPISADSRPALPPGQYLEPAAVARWLARVAPPEEAGGGAETGSLYLTPQNLRQWANSKDAVLTEWHRFLTPILEGPGGDALLKSDTGLVALRHGAQGLAIVPPFPVASRAISDTWNADPLRSLLSTDYTVGVVLLRLGRYLVAVFQGTQPLITKTDTRYVKGKHHAGGTSQLRFKRIREGQMRKLFDETCQVVRSRFEPYDRELDYILLGGEQLTLSAFLKVCPYLQRKKDITLNRRLNIRDPKRDTLETVADMLRQSRVWVR